MKNLQTGLHYFFRTSEDINYMQNKYLMFACVMIWAVVFFVSYRKNIKKLNIEFIRVSGFTLLSLQLAVCIWLLSVRSNPLFDSLPLYFCRMASIVIGYSLMRYRIKGKVVNFFALFSVFGASIALLVPVMENYNFPHITGVTYILIHSLLLFESMYVVRTSGVNLSRNTIIKISAAVIIPIHILNIVIGSNYAYTMKLPSILSVIPDQCAAVFIVATTVYTVIIVQMVKNSGNTIRETISEKIVFGRNN